MSQESAKLPLSFKRNLKSYKTPPPTQINIILHMNIFYWLPGWTERDRTLGMNLQYHCLTLFKTQHNISVNVLILLMQNYLPCFYFLSLGLVTLGSREWGINFNHFAAKVLENPWTQGMSWHSGTISKEVTLGGVGWWGWDTFSSHKLGSGWLGGGGWQKDCFFSFFTLTPFLLIKISCQNLKWGVVHLVLPKWQMLIWDKE